MPSYHLLYNKIHSQSLDSTREWNWKRNVISCPLVYRLDVLQNGSQLQFYNYPFTRCHQNKCSVWFTDFQIYSHPTPQNHFPKALIKVTKENVENSLSKPYSYDCNVWKYTYVEIGKNLISYTATVELVALVFFKISFNTALTIPFLVIFFSYYEHCIIWNYCLIPS